MWKYYDNYDRLQRNKILPEPPMREMLEKNIYLLLENLMERARSDGRDVKRLLNIESEAEEKIGKRTILDYIDVILWFQSITF
jgi:hypothetical protein